MKTLHLNKFFFLLLYLLCFNSFAQTPVEVEVHIENQKVINNDFFFDIYLNTTPGSDDLLLGNSSFVLEFNAQYFDNPTIEKIRTNSTPEVGYCTFVSTANDDPNNISTKYAVQQRAYGGTFVDLELDENLLLIDLLGVSPGDLNTLEQNVPRINGDTLKHCLGRFKMSSINNNNGTMGLLWNCGTSSSRYITVVQTYDPNTLNESIIDLQCRAEIDASLPIELLDFDLNVLEKSLYLTWETAVEINFDGFFLERSENGVDFQKISWLKGKGKDQTKQAYSYNDSAVFPCKNYYYRLRMVDLDGTEKISNTLSGNLECKKDLELSLAPNPTKGNTEVFFNSTVETPFQLSVYDSLGRLMKRSDHIASRGFNSVSIDLKNLATGIYMLEINIDGKKNATRLILTGS